MFPIINIVIKIGSLKTCQNQQSKIFLVPFATKPETCNFFLGPKSLKSRPYDQAHWIWCFLKKTDIIQIWETSHQITYWPILSLKSFFPEHPPPPQNVNRSAENSFKMTYFTQDFNPLFSYSPFSDFHCVWWTIDFNNDLYAKVRRPWENTALQSYQSGDAPRCPRRSVETWCSMWVKELERYSLSRK